MNPKIYWDSCIFIAWLKGEPQPEDVRLGIEAVVRDVDRGATLLFTSVLTEAEVLRCTLSQAAAGSFESLFRRRNVQMMETTRPIAQLTGRIRDYYETSPDRPKVWTADSIHLATAIHYEAVAFHTLDGYRKENKPTKLLSLGLSVAGHSLKVCTPPPPQQLGML